MNQTKAPATSPVAERRKERRRVNFLLEENGWFGRTFEPQVQDPWSCTKRTGGRSGRWDAFEEWQRQAKQAQPRPSTASAACHGSHRRRRSSRPVEPRRDPPAPHA
jgi:hypothetical protein